MFYLYVHSVLFKPPLRRHNQARVDTGLAAQLGVPAPAAVASFHDQRAVGLLGVVLALGRHLAGLNRQPHDGVAHLQLVLRQAGVDAAIWCQFTQVFMTIYAEI